MSHPERQSATLTSTSEASAPGRRGAGRQAGTRRAGRGGAPGGDGAGRGRRGAGRGGTLTSEGWGKTERRRGRRNLAIMLHRSRGFYDRSHERLVFQAMCLLAKNVASPRLGPAPGSVFASGSGFRVCC